MFTCSFPMTFQAPARYMQVNATGAVCRCPPPPPRLHNALDDSPDSRCNHWQLSSCRFSGYSQHFALPCKANTHGFSLYVSPPLFMFASASHRYYQWRYNKRRQPTSCWVSVTPGRWKKKRKGEKEPEQRGYLFRLTKHKARRRCVMMLRNNRAKVSFLTHTEPRSHYLLWLISVSGFFYLLDFFFSPARAMLVILNVFF